MTFPTSPRARGHSHRSERQGSFGSDLIDFARECGKVALWCFIGGFVAFLAVYGLQLAGVLS